MQALMDALFMLCEVIAMIASKTTKATGAIATELSTKTVEDTIADVIQVVYTSTKERMKAPILHFVEGAHIEFIQQCFLDPLFVGNLYHFAEWERFMDAVYRK